MKINIIFPMAGDGVRFGGKEFKPFLFATEELFIELAKEPFNKLKNIYDIEFYFIFRKDQEVFFQVSNKLKELFNNDKINCCILESKTKGPIDTISQAIEQYNIKGSTFICDCDHTIDIKPMIEYLDNEIIVPIYNIKEDDSKNWGKVIIYSDKYTFCEKEYIPFSEDYKVKGLIGCYYFKNIEILKDYSGYENMSDILNNFKDIKFIEIKNANFFGTPELLNNYRYILASQKTFLIDFDGTIGYLDNKISYNDVKILDGALKKLEEWKKENHKIIITTSRKGNKLEEFKNLLSMNNIPYDKIITDLTSGPRILINDKKPYNELHEMAIAYEVERNIGIKDINICITPKILKILKGGSFANTYLIEENSKKIVRKYIKKTKELYIHYETLKRQYEDVKRFEYYSSNLVPKIFNSYENNNSFYYDMEYLEGYEELSKYNPIIIKEILPKVINRLNEDIYCYSKKIDGKKWFQSFLEEKILAKYNLIENTDTIFYNILNNEMIINSIKINSLKTLIQNIDITLFDILLVSPIHGDLSLENILYNEKINEFRLIDTSGSRYVDVKEMDYAKILQSLITKYETWDMKDKLVDINEDNYKLNKEYLDLKIENYNFIFNNNFISYKRAIIFLACYLIRMFPFLLKKSKEHAILGLLLSCFYLHKINYIKI